MPFDGTGEPSAGASQATIVLNMMELSFAGGARWGCRTFCTDDGKLLGRSNMSAAKTGHCDDRALQYLAHAINLRQLAKGPSPTGSLIVYVIAAYLGPETKGMHMTADLQIFEQDECP